MEIVNKFQRFRSNWSSSCNDWSTNYLAWRTTDIRYKARHHNRKWDKINERMVRRRGSKIQWVFVEGVTHRKPSNDSFKMGTRSQAHRLEPSDLLRRDNHSSKLRQGIAWEFIWQRKRSCELSSIQPKSMFGVASQVKASITSSVLNQI